MPDITMCTDKKCKLYRKCYRYRALPNPYWQSYFTGSPRNTETDECEYFYKITKEQLKT